MSDDNERRTPLPGEDREGWMIFQHAGPLHLLTLTPQQVDIRDIIKGLSQINRFNGQSARPIPVLWHSLIVMQLCAEQSRATRLEALFHDAGETYVGDWIRPLKDSWGKRLANLRERIQETVFEAVGLRSKSAILSKAVHDADKITLRCEMVSPWGFSRVPSWHEPPSREEIGQLEEAVTRIGCPPENAHDRNRLADLFLRHANLLTGPDAPIRASIEKATGKR